MLHRETLLIALAFVMWVEPLARHSCAATAQCLVFALFEKPQLDYSWLTCAWAAGATQQHMTLRMTTGVVPTSPQAGKPPAGPCTLTPRKRMTHSVKGCEAFKQYML